MSFYDNEMEHSTVGRHSLLNIYHFNKRFGPAAAADCLTSGSLSVCKRLKTDSKLIRC